MAQDPRTIAQLKRTIRQLEARLVVAQEEIDRQWTAIRNSIYRSVDAEMRVKLAVEILQDEES